MNEQQFAVRFGTACQLVIVIGFLYAVYATREWSPLLIEQRVSAIEKRLDALEQKGAER
jgi:hypothetical protein